MITKRQFAEIKMLLNEFHCLPKILELKLRSSIIFAIILASIVVIISMPVRADSSKNINILLIFSWDKNMPWQVEVEKGFEELKFEEPANIPDVFLKEFGEGL